jgi:hypothetical protein
MIKSKSYNLKNITLARSATNEVLEVYITNFWNDIYQPIINNKVNSHLMVLCKVQFADSSLGY